MAAQVTRHTKPDDLPAFLSPQEVCVYMKVGKTTLYEILRRGELPHVKFGRLIRIPKSAIADLAERNT